MNITGFRTYGRKCRYDFPNPDEVLEVLKPGEVAHVVEGATGITYILCTGLTCWTQVADSPLESYVHENTTTDEKVIERRVAREILNLIDRIYFSQEYKQYRINNGSNGARDLLIDSIRKTYLER